MSIRRPLGQQEAWQGKQGDLPEVDGWRPTDAPESDDSCLASREPRRREHALDVVDDADPHEREGDAVEELAREEPIDRLRCELRVQPRAQRVGGQRDGEEDASAELG